MASAVLIGHIDMLRRFGFKGFYGMRPVDLLRASGTERKLFVVAIDDREKALHC